MRLSKPTDNNNILRLKKPHGLYLENK